MDEHAEISTSSDAANNALILALGRRQGAANRLEYILGRALEVDCGISHLMFEVLLILGRAGEPGLSMRAVAVAQEQVLTTGGVTSLVDRGAQRRPLCGLRAGGPARADPAGCPSREWRQLEVGALPHSSCRAMRGTT
ncbi:hypothetical protein [Streptomyces sviceus]|uniref:hypothetical protein n=1 Tax=Streptomyces sviceus TaxID=285530 RepID=UPI0036E9AAEB